MNELANTHYYVPIIIFLITYAFIISEKINRAVVALLGATLMIIFQIVDVESAYEHHIEWGTIFLLIGMMIIVSITKKSGFFQYMAIKAAKLAKGQPIRILVILSLLTALLSAFLDNVTTVLLIVPVTFSITKLLNVKSTPFLLSEIIFSNIGGTATLIGDPPNIMIGSANKNLTYHDFLFNLAPAVIIILLVIMTLIYFLYRKNLTANPELIATLMSLNEHDYIEDKKLLKKSVTVLLLTIVSFTLHSIIHVDASVVALFWAAFLLLLTIKEEHEIEKIFASIEWVTIFFFIGLFILVGGLVDSGVIESLALKALAITDGNIQIASTLILWVSGIASATIDNIPFVATMIPLIENLSVGMGYNPDSEAIDVLWWSLALGSCLGGNGTLIGATANVIVAGLASKEDEGFSYLDFLKVGAPLTLLTLIIAHGYIFVRYFM